MKIRSVAALAVGIIFIATLGISCTSTPEPGESPHSLEDDDFAKGAFDKPSSQAEEPEKLPPFLQGKPEKKAQKPIPGRSAQEGKSAPVGKSHLAGQPGFQCKDEGQVYDNGETYRSGCLICRCTASPTFSRVQCRELKKCKTP